MTRSTNTKREVTTALIGNMMNALISAKHKLIDEENKKGKLSTTYTAGLDASAKQDMATSIKLIRWLVQDYFNIQNIPAAYTDAEIDIIDIDIRTTED